MKHKISLILLVTLSFSLFSFYSVHKIKNKVNWIPKFRHLDGTTSQQIKELCENADEKLFKYYYEEGSYETNFEANSEDSQILINLIRDQNTEDITEYIKKCAMWLAFIIFGILSIIGWIICCCCCCCNCCCFKNCCKSKILQFVIFVLCAACYGCVAILGIYTAASANNAIKGLNNTSCSLLNFVDDIINGQKRVTIPYWKGIDGLKEILQSIQDGIMDTVTGNNKEIFYQSTDLYNQNLNSAETDLNSMQVNDVKVSGNYYSIVFDDSKKVVPSCIYLWDNYLNSFKIEFNALKQSSSPVINNMSTIFDDVTGCTRTSDVNCGKSSTFNAISESITAIEDISGSFKNIQSDITDPWYDLQSTINDIAKNSLKIAGSVICVFCASICALILLYKLLNCVGKIFKIIIHVLWNIVALTIIVSFILGGVIGLLGKIGTDLVSVMNFIIGIDNLNSTNPEIIGDLDEKSKGYLIKCLHDNGDLATELNLHNNAQAVQDLNNIKEQLTTLKSQYGGKTESENVAEYNSLLKDDNYYTNLFFYCDTSNCPNNTEFKLATELEDVNTKLDGCSVSEQWGNVTINVSPKTFVNIYENIDANSYTCSGVSTIGKRFNDIGTFFKTNTSVDNFRTNQENFNNEMKAIYTNLDKAINSSLAIISAITDKLNENVGEDGQLWGMINCKFMGEGVKVLLKNLHDGLGKRFINLGNTLVAMAFLEAFAIVFTLLTLKKPDEDPNAKK